jgi:hypothetical protein
MLWVQARPTSKAVAQARESGTAINARQMADGRCVKTIAFTFPIRLAMIPATSVLIAETMEVAKKMAPK